MNAEDFVSRLDGVEVHGDGAWMATCPAHGDTAASLSVRAGDDGRPLVTCHGGCDTLDVVQAMGLGMKDLFTDEPSSGGAPASPAKPRKPATPKKRAPLGDPTEVYDYTDEEGALLYQALRYEPKTFRQRRPDGKGGWSWSMKGQRLVLYRLPEVLKAIELDQRVYVVEGEKDAETGMALGITATSNVAGSKAGVWKPEYSEVLRGADVVLIPDRDPDTRHDDKRDRDVIHRAGQQHMARVARSLHGVAGSVKVLELPIKDLTDWVEQMGGTRDALEALVRAEGVEPIAYAEAQEAWVAETKAQLEPKVEQAKLEIAKPMQDARPVLWDTGGDMLHAVDDARKVLSDSNDEEPRLFWFAGKIAWIVSRGPRRTVSFVGPAEMRLHMATIASWHRRTTKAEGPSEPPKSTIDAILAHPDLGLPVLRRFADVPCVVSSGDAVSTRGYDAGSGLYLEPSRKWDIKDWAIEPGQDDMERATATLTEGVLGDFPFVEDADKANALAFLIGIVARNMIDGPVPHFMISKPTPGTGATLLTEALTAIGLGAPAHATTFSRSEEELEKKIGALLIKGAPVIFFDNVSRRIDSSSLAMAVTSRDIGVRILGKSETADVPVYCSWISSGNNPTVSNEMARRTLRIHLDRRVERPQDVDTNGFKHPDLLLWVKQNADELLSSVVCMIRWWVKQGRKPSAVKVKLGMFESWLDVVGGVLASCGVNGLLENQESLYAESDAEGNAWKQFFDAWWEENKGIPVTVKSLMQFAEDILPVRGHTDASKRMSLGKMISAQKGRIYNGRTIRRHDARIHNAVQWYLDVVGDAAEEEEDVPF